MSEIDKKKISEYVMANAAPLVGRAFNFLVKKGSIKESHDHAHLYQEAMAGLMKAIKSYDPSRGVKFASFAMPTIIGALKAGVSHQESKFVIPHDRAAAKRAQKQAQAEAQTMQVGGGSNKTGIEAAGGQVSEDGGAQGASVDMGPDAKFARQYSQFVNSEIKRKVEAGKAKMAAKQAEAQPEPAPAPTPQPAQPAQPAQAPAPTPKTIIRRTARPDQAERLKHIDAAKMARGSGGGNDNE